MTSTHNFRTRKATLSPAWGWQSREGVLKEETLGHGAEQPLWTLLTLPLIHLRCCCCVSARAITIHSISSDILTQEISFLIPERDRKLINGSLILLIM